MYRRHLEHKLRESLADTRVVMIAGPRQSGKTTLVRQLTDNNRPYVTLDDEATYQAATEDPVSFIGQFDYATIDPAITTIRSTNRSASGPRSSTWWCFRGNKGGLPPALAADISRSGCWLELKI